MTLRDDLLDRATLVGKFDVLNYLVFGAMLAASAVIGIVFWCRSDKHCISLVDIFLSANQSTDSRPMRELLTMYIWQGPEEQRGFSPRLPADERVPCDNVSDGLISVSNHYIGDSGRGVRVGGHLHNQPGQDSGRHLGSGKPIHAGIF